jgi:hypothetical protein
VVGGFGPNSTMPATVLVFDAIGERFTTGGELLGGRVGHSATMHSATLLADGKVLLVASGDVLELGGNNLVAQAAEDRVIQFNAATSATTVTGKLPTARGMAAGVQLLDGRVLVTGGTTVDAAQAIKGVELYTPQTGAAVTGPAMAAARMYHSADLLSTGKVLVIGGKTNAIDVLPSAELYS